MSDPFDIVSAVATGGASSLGDYWDPGHFFTESPEQALARDQWEWQKKKYDENYAYQKYWYEVNHRISEHERQYQHNLNRLQMEREDTAVQRRVADLKASGLSPTLAAGSAADTGAMHAGSVSQSLAPSYQMGENPRIHAAMFKQQMMRDNLELASTILGNVSNISKTKAETELIKAQEERFSAETPTELRIKEELARLNEELHSIKVDQAKQDLTNSEADYITKLWDHVAANDDHILKTTQAVREELGVKLDEQALRIGQSEENIKKTEALIKGISLQLEQYKLETETQLMEFYKNLGVPRGVHDKPAYAPFTLIRGLVEGLDKGGSYLWDKAASGLSKLKFGIKSPKSQGFIFNNMH